MPSLSNLTLPLRLRQTRGRILCRLSLPQLKLTSEPFTRELVLIASPKAPHLRRLTLYSRKSTRTEGPDCPPLAA